MVNTANHIVDFKILKGSRERERERVVWCKHLSKSWGKQTQTPSTPSNPPFPTWRSSGRGLEGLTDWLNLPWLSPRRHWGMDWPNMAPKCLPRPFGHQKFNPPKKWSFPWAKWSFGRKSQQNLVYRCSLGRCFLKFMLREPDPTISSPPHPHFKAPALSVVQGKVMCCEPQRFVCEKKIPAKPMCHLGKEKWDMKMR